MHMCIIKNYNLKYADPLDYFTNVAPLIRLPVL